MLHTPPAGFPAPLGLGLVRAQGGWMTLAHLSPGEEAWESGAPVWLTLEHGLYRAEPARTLELPWLETRASWRRLPTRLRMLKRRFWG